ncbi:type III restriction-modification system endonuclease [Roseimaritima sediminicola]|uniref:type III restriction-modification system endonuclease n=1 Tax=Roseimaritima sediminicola TaxID=2662066 RepID=UPI0012983A20|nr:DEAD/DEAH box helicase family protein [Roseimaritima sediminicola]
MKIQFKVQQYQTDAVQAVVDCFAGQPCISTPKYAIDPGIEDAAKSRALLDALELEGFRNADLRLTNAQVLENIRRIQLEQNVPQDSQLIASPSCKLNLDVEMETGTGKTYCYIKTMFELHKQYGWNKFIIVVPSIAIREGVYKSFEITADHFLEQYGRRARYFIYDSSQLHELESFSSDAGINVMIINVQAFNAFKSDAKNKTARIMFSARDDFQSRRPIDVLKKNKPILILDEPQRMGGKATVKALAEFDPMMILRYSATHKDEHNKVYRLDALDAYNQKLVKKIAVRGIATKGLKGTDKYLYLEDIRLSKNKPPVAVLEMEQKTANGVKRIRKLISKGDDLFVLSGELDEYKGFVVSDIDFRGIEGFGQGFIEFTNGELLTVGTASGDENEDTLRRLQIRESIKAHFEKEQELFAQGIKCLTLFFIDTVKKYRDYSREDEQGDYARYFEQEYKEIREEFRTLFAEDEAYQRYLDGIDPGATHQGYFSIDKKSKQLTDPTIKKTGEMAGETDDVDAYDLILKDKETLLALPDDSDDDRSRELKNVRFIFSHSALREGWDNPNVFTIGMLKPADYEGAKKTTRRQEVGRGLRLCVDSQGRRIDDPTVVHDVNVLTVVANESFQDFVGKLQGEMRDAISARPRFASEEYFTGKLLQTEEGETIVSKTMASQIYFYLVQNGYTDYEKRITPKYHEAKDAGQLADLPEELKPLAEPIFRLIDSVFDDSKLPTPDNGRNPKGNPINQKNLARDEFQQLWKRINHKAVYAVDFETDELIANCVEALNQHLKVSKLRYEVHHGIQRDVNTVDDLENRKAFEVKENRTDTIDAAVSTDVKYDLIGKISEATQLTRKTVAAILTRITEPTFLQYHQNPEEFLSKASRLINEQKATVIIEHLVYDPLEGEHFSDIFTADKKADISAAYPAERHVYDYVITDSKTERAFVETLDKSTEVCVYAKLPKAFSIPTPVGNYNPDWAIAFEQGHVKHVFFVAETKGSMNSLELRKLEEAKIECAKKFFAKITSNQVKYDVVDSYDQLMTLVQ